MGINSVSIISKLTKTTRYKQFHLILHFVLLLGIRFYLKWQRSLYLFEDLHGLLSSKRNVFFFKDLDLSSYSI